MGDKKNKSGSVLGYIIHLTGLLILAVFLTLGLMYWLGDVIIATLYALMIIVFLSVAIFILTSLKTTKRYQKKKRKIEKFFVLPLYFFLGLITLLPTVHFLDVELDKKNKVHENVRSQLDVLDDNLNNYSSWIVRKKEDYELNRATAVAERQISHRQKEAEVKAFEDKMDMEYNVVQSQINAFVRSIHNQIDGWNFQALISVQSLVQNRIREIYEKIKEGSSDHPFTGNTPFIAEAKPLEIIDLTDMKSSIRSNNIFLALPIFLICHFMILLPYFIATRSGTGFVKVESRGSGGVIIRKNKNQ